MSPCLSVVIPTRDRCGILKGVLAEYLAQAGQVCAEVIVVDDGSSDGTRDLLDGISNTGIALRWVSCPAAGPAAARNRGVAMARGPLLLFTGDDMFPQPGLLAGHVRAHGTLRRAAVLGHVRWDPAMRVSPLMRCMAPNGPLFNYRKLMRSETGRYRFFYTANLSMTAETLGKERFHEGFRTAAFEDAELGFRLERSGVRLVYRRELVVRHRHAMSARDMARRLHTLRQGREYLSTLHPELKPSVMTRVAGRALLAAVKAWAPLESLLSLEPRVPKRWTNGRL
ncbi:glycosyltransferase family 2 protein [Candidatus Fermentibacteria bacterium]|nr:glycosyltransferase family 2 protein [Candidatus Fermentibacteria bacterium]